MRICLVNLSNLAVLAEEFNTRSFGGAEVQQTLLAKKLSERGYQVTMVTADYGQPDGASWYGIQVFKAFRLDAGIPVLRFIFPRWIGMWAALGRADADVYYTSVAGMHVGLIAMFCRARKKGLVFRLAHDSDSDPDRLKIRYFRDKKLYEYGLRRADRVLCQHDRQRLALKRNYGVVSRVSMSFVESPRRELALSARDIPVLWVSQFRPFKRPDLILELARLLPVCSIHLVGGPDTDSPDLYESAQKEAASLPNIRAITI